MNFFTLIPMRERESLGEEGKSFFCLAPRSHLDCAGLFFSLSLPPIIGFTLDQERSSQEESPSYSFSTPRACIHKIHILYTHQISQPSLVTSSGISRGGRGGEEKNGDGKGGLVVVVVMMGGVQSLPLSALGLACLRRDILKVNS